MSIDKDINADTMDPKTVLGRLEILEHHAKIRQVEAEQHDSWLRQLYRCVGVNYPGDEPMSEAGRR